MVILVPSPSTMTLHSTEEWMGVYVTEVAEAGVGRSFAVLPSCLSQGFYSIMTKKQAEEERVYSAYTSTLLFITKRSQDWNSNRSESRS